jgi:WhiB family transcriptional regulator, redox-sensing transcriptional regulator
MAGEVPERTETVSHHGYMPLDRPRQNDVALPAPPRGDRTWQDRGRCHTTDADPDLFFTEPATYKRGGTASRRASTIAIAICDLCPVREPCLEYSLSNEIWFGTWGGVSQTERRLMIQSRRKSKSA